jgi:hypothetical protein
VNRTASFRHRICSAVAAIVLACAVGCAHEADSSALRAKLAQPTTQLSSPVYDPDVFAYCDPPIGWKPDPLKHTSAHTHQVWISPTGATAYAVIHFSLPFPVGINLALTGFLNQMKSTSGQAILDSREDDPQLGGIRFVAEGGHYKIRTNFFVEGWEGWAVYAGTLRNLPENSEELDLAVLAREHTIIGRPSGTQK